MLSLAGCAGYVPPTAGPTAQIKFDGGAYAYIDEAKPAGRMCASVPQARGKTWREQTIRADRRLWIMHGIDTRGTMFGMFCGFVYSFEPEADAKYVATYKLDGRGCRFRLEKQSESGALVPVDAVEREDKTCF